MKVYELFENVLKVDFAQNRASRDMDTYWKQNKEKDVADNRNIESENEAESLTVHELAEFEEYMTTAKKKGRVPGFETMDDCVAYLLADIELPQHITRSTAIGWFSKMSEEDREKARMIAHHADRMLQIFEMLKTKIHGIQNTWYKRFNGKVPKGWDAVDGAAWLDSEFNYDISQLKNLKKAILILGQ